MDIKSVKVTLVFFSDIMINTPDNYWFLIMKDK